MHLGNKYLFAEPHCKVVSKEQDCQCCQPCPKWQENSYTRAGATEPPVSPPLLPSAVA